ncbi:MAG TPA: MerR family transcriptional regulator [Candidatus Scybalousia intestinigallinarum]|nr:MerR family transcriptional regulator [Candidatus Scybalousia intestinigallinarum]
MYKIGDFSKIVDIPVRTLRYYAEYGVLVPSEIDPLTGYKYYSDDNVIECEFIKLLKSLDFTLDEIIEYKEGLDEEILEKKKAEFEEKIYLLNLKIDRVNQIQEDIENKRSYGKEKETERERVLRRKYEKRNIRKII